MRFDVLTLFPEIFQGYLTQSILKLALDKGLVGINLWNLRDWASGRHKSVDDRPFGGGPGMVLMPGPVYSAVEDVRARHPDPGLLVLLTPAGERLTQPVVKELAGHKRLLLLCGRYEGFDERIRLGLRPREISAGDFVCNGGEVPAMLVIDTVVRYVPGVLGDPESVTEESHSEAGLLEYPQYTRPREFRGMAVPDVLLSGDHGAVARWRREQSLARSAAGSEATATPGSAPLHPGLYSGGPEGGRAPGGADAEPGESAAEMTQPGERPERSTIPTKEGEDHEEPTAGPRGGGRG